MNKNFLLITCFGLLFGAMVTGGMYLEGERLLAEDDLKTDYSTLSSFIDCVDTGYFNKSECELTHASL